MRTLKELFIVLKDNEQYFENGLCPYCGTLWSRNIITYQERIVLENYIKNNRPRWWSKHYDKQCSSSLYFWEIDNWKPRLKWINAQIARL